MAVRYNKLWKLLVDKKMSKAEAAKLIEKLTAEMRDAARRNAVEMIEAARRYIFTGETTEEELSARIGSRSYLSGLDEDDPRNRAVSFLLPPKKEERRKP